MPKEHIPTLIEALRKTEDKHTRTYLVHGLVSNGVDAKAALPLFDELAEGEDQELKAVGSTAAREIRMLIEQQKATGKAPDKESETSKSTPKSPAKDAKASDQPDEEKDSATAPGRK